jgi:hypothetical protein
MNGAMSTFEKFVTGVVGIGVITALALHATDLSKLVASTGQASSQIMSTAEKG